MSTSPDPEPGPYGLQGLLPLLEEFVDVVKVAPQQLVLQEQERLNTVLVIIEGVIKVRSLLPDGSEEVLGMLGGGECIGIASVFGATHAWGDVVALTPVRMMQLPKATVISLIRRHPDAAFHFMAMMAASLGTVRERVLTRHLQPSERVLASLTELARKASAHHPGTRPLMAPAISQTELAILTGVARETCCRCLSKLERRGAIKRLPEGWELATDAAARDPGPPNRSSRPPALPSQGRSRTIVRN